MCIRDRNAILELNVSGGSGENAYVSGYRVAGKTGTSEKTVQNLQTGEKSYIASFCGFAPADDPQYALLLFFDEPNGDSIYGSMVAAPVFGSIMEDVLPYLGIEHQYTEEELAKLDTTAPDVEGKTLSEAKNIISQSELDYQLYGCLLYTSDVYKRQPAGPPAPSGRRPEAPRIYPWRAWKW